MGSVLLVEETRVHRENHWQTLSHNVESKTPRLIGIQTHNVNGDRHWLHKYIILKGKVHFCTRTIHKYLWIRRVCRDDNGMVLALHGYDSMVLDLPCYDGMILELHGYDSMVLDFPGYDGMILDLHGYNALVLELHGYDGMILELHLLMKSMTITAEDSSLIPIWVEMCFKIQLYKVCQ